MKYIDDNYFKYENLIDLKNRKNGVLINNQYLLNHRAKAVLYDKEYNNILYSIDNIQTLYLYPLTIIDYYKNRKSQHPIMLQILEIDKNINYVKYLQSLKKVIAVELKITKPITTNIIRLLKYLNDNNILVSVKLENINIDIQSIVDYINCLKIKFISNIDDKKINNFIYQLKKINQNRKNNTVIFLKGYLNENDAQYYKIIYNQLEDLKVNIIQISKELIPLNSYNVYVSRRTQNIIRNLEKYSSKRKTKFISVKDISTLYYPRFKLDERNSRNCRACNLKPCLIGNKLFPCKDYEIVNKKLYIKNINEKAVNNYKFGQICSDCCCIFENDSLENLDKFKGNLVLEVTE